MNVRPALGSVALPVVLPHRRSILGVDVIPLGWQEGIDFLAQRVRAGRFTKVAFLNAHVANLAARDENLRAILADFDVLSDGVGLDIAGRVLHGHRFPANLNGTDFVPAFIASQTTPLRIGLVGATRANVERAANHLRAFVPHHDVVLVQDGFFSAEQEVAILDKLRVARPDILLVAMGVPRQETWIAKRLTPEHCTVAIGVGALFDFLSGAVPRAPLPMRQLRLEWLFRLMIEPGRMWRRYVIGNPLFLMRVLRSKLFGRDPSR